MITCCGVSPSTPTLLSEIMSFLHLNSYHFYLSFKISISSISFLPFFSLISFIIHHYILYSLWVLCNDYLLWSESLDADSAIGDDALLAAQQVLELRVVADLSLALEVDPGQQDGQSTAVNMQHAARNTVKRHLEEER